MIKKKIQPDNLVFTDCLRIYDVPAVSEFRIVRVSEGGIEGEARYITREDVEAARM